MQQAEEKRARSENLSWGGGPAKKAKIEPSVAKPATCDLCGVDFPSRSKMFKHIKSEHPEKYNNPFKTDETKKDETETAK